MRKLATKIKSVGRAMGINYAVVQCIVGMVAGGEKGAKEKCILYKK